VAENGPGDGEQAVARLPWWRRPLWLTAAVVAVLVVAGGLTAVALSRQATTPKTTATEIPPSTPTGPPTTQQEARRGADTSGIPGVIAWEGLEDTQVAGPVTYSVTPPVGGPHAAVGMNSGVYTDPVPAERAVLDLEHGAVWITYRPDLPSRDVAVLRALVGRQTLVDEAAVTGIPGQQGRYVVLSPWADDTLPSRVVISAWGHQLRVDSVTDPRLPRFLDTFRDSRQYAPGYGGAVDGIPVRTGGRPVTGGATVDNPPGTAPGA
jgi:hypothetical protein